MKKVTMISAIISASLLLTACSKESAFKSAINDNLKSSYVCLDLSANRPIFGVMNMSFEDYRAYSKESEALIVKMKEDGKWVNDYSGYDKGLEKRLGTLVAAGLLTKEEKTQPAIRGGYSNAILPNKTMIIDLYSLTDAGKDTLRGDSFSGEKKSFCFAHPAVEKIISYQESTIFGHNVAQVKYSYKYVDVAKWAQNKDIQAAFPGIQKTLNDDNNTDTVDLMKTKNGWRPTL
jgi:hypothetical protein